MTKSDEPAFPWVGTSLYEKSRPGLSKREYFSALAMQGMMTLPPPDMVRWAADPKTKGTVADWVAVNSVGMADALLAELEKEQ